MRDEGGVRRDEGEGGYNLASTWPPPDTPLTPTWHPPEAEPKCVGFEKYNPPSSLLPPPSSILHPPSSLLHLGNAVNYRWIA